MKINKLNILFISANNKIRNDGKVPLLCRLTYLVGSKLLFFFLQKNRHL